LTVDRAGFCLEAKEHLVIDGLASFENFGIDPIVILKTRRF